MGEKCNGMNKNNNGGFLAKNRSPDERRRLFYMICIWVRFLTGMVIYYHGQRKVFQVIILGWCIMTIFSLYSKLDECVWWSRRFHYLSAIVLGLVSLLSLLEVNQKYFNHQLMGLIIVIDVLYGFLDSIIKKPWD